ncbi:MAG: branched-chain amino acid aminotransferase [Alphaproteobacteria bacterium]|nr:branched-chain amino acid aminotransferase [Alphaproteobacteria bacterium]
MTVAIYNKGRWSDENVALLGPMDHAFWMASVVFDGARAFGGLAPDLDRHCERVVRSARSFGMAPTHSAAEIEQLCREGIRRFPRSAELYVRPMFFVREGMVLFEPKSTEFALAIYDTPMPPDSGFRVCLSPYRRPAADQAPTDAKASCLYPNSARAVRDAVARGFDNAVMLDPDGNVAELASANIWIVRDGVAQTPAPNGTFLSGITRARVAGLLAQSGIRVEERTISFAEVMAADEVFSTGNYGKVQPIIRVEDRDLQPGPVYARARELYFRFAQASSVF